MHRVMGVDIETYSSVDLAEAGVYAYVEAPDFDILLISYIFDDWGEDDVKTIDCFDADPDMMAEFCEALLDPQIVKTAFNANFERTCLAKWLQKPMPPEEWRRRHIRRSTAESESGRDSYCCRNRRIHSHNYSRSFLRCYHIRNRSW